MSTRRAMRAPATTIELLHRLGDRICSHSSVGVGTEHAHHEADAPQRAGEPWFLEQLDQARRTITDVLADRGIAIANRTVADIASADGAVSVALLTAGASRVVAFDEDRTDRVRLEELASGTKLLDGLPPHLELRAIMNGGLPCPDDEFDLAVSGGSFTRLRWLTRITGEVRRVLRNDGVFLVHVGPFFDSAEGGRLPSEVGRWSHLIQQPDVIEQRVRRHVGDPAHADAILDRFRRLNRASLDEIQQALLTGGFDIVWAGLDAPPTDVPAELQHRPLSVLLPSAVTLLARPRSS